MNTEKQAIVEVTRQSKENTYTVMPAGWKKSLTGEDVLQATSIVRTHPNMLPVVMDWLIGNRVKVISKIYETEGTQ